MDSTVQSKKILITGGSGGIGKAVASDLKKQEHQVYLTGKTKAKLDLVMGELDLPGEVADLTIPKQVTNICLKAKEEMDGVDAVIHCAGVGLIKSFSECTDDDFVNVMNQNLRSTFLLGKELCPIFAEQKFGRFFVVPGILGRSPMRGSSLYSASKYGLVGLVKCMALEYQRLGVQFSMFFFGGVDTGFWDNIEMKVDRSKMIPAEVAASQIVSAINAPDHLVVGEVVLQPEGHQL